MSTYAKAPSRARGDFRTNAAVAGYYPGLVLAFAAVTIGLRDMAEAQEDAAWKGGGLPVPIRFRISN